MSVNGTGLDRRTNKPLPDSTSWSLRVPGSKEPVLDSKHKPFEGMSAADAFAAARQLRRSRDLYVVPVRT